jgi:periplasmic nitrate reductase NapE
MSMSEKNIQKKKEHDAFIFLTVVIAPLLAVIIVGGYGLLIWLYQLFMGPPAG